MFALYLHDCIVRNNILFEALFSQSQVSLRNERLKLDVSAHADYHVTHVLRIYAVFMLPLQQQQQQGEGGAVNGASSSLGSNSSAAMASRKAGPISSGRSTRMPFNPKERATAVKSVGPKRRISSAAPGRLPALRLKFGQPCPKPELLFTTNVTAIPRRRAVSSSAKW